MNPLGYLYRTGLLRYEKLQEGFECFEKSTSSLKDLIVNLRKQELAYKIYDNNKLTQDEKEEVVFYLTGYKPEARNRRGPGRPSTFRRDIEMAFDYLLNTKDPNKIPTNTRTTLIKKYGIESPSNLKDTYQNAINKGIKYIEFMLRDFRKALKEKNAQILQGFTDDNIEFNLEILDLLDKHRLRNEKKGLKNKKQVDSST